MSKKSNSKKRNTKRHLSKRHSKKNKKRYTRKKSQKGGGGNLGAWFSSAKKSASQTASKGWAATKQSASKGWAATKQGVESAKKGALKQGARLSKYAKKKGAEAKQRMGEIANDMGRTKKRLWQESRARSAGRVIKKGEGAKGYTEAVTKKKLANAKANDIRLEQAKINFSRANNKINRKAIKSVNADLAYEKSLRAEAGKQGDALDVVRKQTDRFRKRQKAASKSLDKTFNKYNPKMDKYEKTIAKLEARTSSRPTTRQLEGDLADAKRLSNTEKMYKKDLLSKDGQIVNQAQAQLGEIKKEQAQLVKKSALNKFARYPPPLPKPSISPSLESKPINLKAMPSTRVDKNTLARRTWEIESQKFASPPRPPPPTPVVEQPPTFSESGSDILF